MNRGAAEFPRGPELHAHSYAAVVRNQPARARGGPLRVVAINLAGGARLEEIARCLLRAPLEGASIILLCEADWRTARSGRIAVAASLAARLGMSMAYLPEFGRPIRGEEEPAFMGNAILSAAPLDEVRVVAMPDPHPADSRNLRRGYSGGFAGLAVRANFRAAPFWLGVAHLHSRCAPAGRAEQITAYLENFPKEGRAIFGGDLNSTTAELTGPGAYARTFAAMLLNSRRFRHPQSYEPMFQRLAAAGFEIDGANAPGRATFTFSRAIPPLLRPRLDWIAVRGVRPVANSAAVVPARESFTSRRLSDHDFITVALDI
jgi:endonuclease/exonuclease/phosphatase family metal-dependent hydrolase